ncbi:hypothetical protein [Azospirillum brasilense]|uniref:hypothetical protein n=1 Tax=Azospirillum brasilense TaxID=192 RepID=UPI000E67D41F|nr:hypothetical protein [Azospirillum brasilense]NUB24772.1 hypothetical protein [Azospirillum brasilense]NUB32689.1 hypothetical protein [Azospirillum brasilense]RIV96990.1 hypothetical protein D2T81_30015 [Azospirillum brasilense]
MGILLAFAPFIAFAVLDRLVGPVEGLIAGALVSATMLLRDWMSPGRTPKILEIGTVLLFGGLALYAVAGGPTQSVMGGAVMGGSVMGVRLLVDAGLLLIVLTSIALRRPFTLQYAREQVAHEFWDDPRFIHTNYVITGVWALAFLVLVIADLILLYRPDLPPRFGIVATVLALVGAIKFTSWYPEHRRSAAGTV